MSICDDYARQYQWRSWPIVLDALPSIDGQFVLDLGCGIGDLAADLATRGARVMGIDANQTVIDYANSRRIENAEFRVADLKTFRGARLAADGIWSSFAAAYFPRLDATIRAWREFLRPGGWIALTEVDDLFGHAPLSHRTQELLNRYVEDALAHERYDFRMGRKLADALRRCDFDIVREFDVADAELSFSGVASPQVSQAWKTRFDQMVLLRDFCASEFDDVRSDFLNCLERHDHRCSATVKCCIATKK